MEILSTPIRSYLLVIRVSKMVKIPNRSAVDLVYKIYGSNLTVNNPPIIVLHGLLGSKKNWESMCKKLVTATDKTAVAVDARNHGDSPNHTSHTYLDLASDLSQLMTKLSINKATIIGHSMGGRTAMVLALTEPEKVVSLVVVDISPVPPAEFYNKFFVKLLDVMEAIEFKDVSNLSQARALAKDKIMASGLIKHAESTHFILMNIAKKADNSFGWVCNIEALRQHFPIIAAFPPEMAGKTYTGPVLFVGGGASDYLPPSDITGIRTFFPKAEIIYIPNVGHNVHAEDPAAFFRVVTQFLKEK